MFLLFSTTHGKGSLFNKYFYEDFRIKQATEIFFSVKYCFDRNFGNLQLFIIYGIFRKRIVLIFYPENGNILNLP